MSRLAHPALHDCKKPRRAGRCTRPLRGSQARGVAARSLLLTFLLLVGVHQASRAQTLHEAARIALAQYPAILAAQSKREAADSDITRAQGAHWPQLAWSGTQSAYNAGNISNNWIQSPTVNLNVWSGWKIQSDVERSQALADSGRHQQNITRDEVALLATEGYLNWALALKKLILARENVAVHEKIRSDITKITQIDQGRRIDLDQAEVRFENAALSLHQRENELVVAVQRLNRMLLGQMPSSPEGTDFELGPFPDTSEHALADLSDLHPVIAQQIAQVEAARAALRSAQSQHSPQVNVSYGKQVYQGSGQGDYVAQLTVNLPIFTGGTTMGSINSAASQLQAAEYGLVETRLTQREKLLTAWSEWTSAKARSTLGLRQAATAQVVVNGYEKQFRVGRRSLLDLLNVQSDLYTYQSNAVSASFEVQISRARVMAAIGKLAFAYQSSSPLVPAQAAVTQARRVTAAKLSDK